MTEAEEIKEAEKFLQAIEESSAWGFIESSQFGFVLIHVNDGLMLAKRFPAMLNSSTKNWLLFLHRVKKLHENPEIMAKRTLGLQEGITVYTTHGHHIPRSAKEGAPDQVERCRGIPFCDKCAYETGLWFRTDDAITAKVVTEPKRLSAEEFLEAIENAEEWNVIHSKNDEWVIELYIFKPDIIEKYLPPDFLTMNAADVTSFFLRFNELASSPGMLLRMAERALGKTSPREDGRDNSLDS